MLVLVADSSSKGVGPRFPADLTLARPATVLFGLSRPVSPKCGSTRPGQPKMLWVGEPGPAPRKEKRPRFLETVSQSSAPHQGQLNYRSVLVGNQVTSGRAEHPIRPALPFWHSPDTSFWGGNGPGGIRTRTCNLDGVPCCRYTTGPRFQSICKALRKRMVSCHTAARAFPIR